ncbi:hypothetical protein [Halomonas sp. BMC6]|uniref:hypothetical protein n=1 Tax=Halomonas sp. BMC6 TaxID=3073244 RepID=UPI0030CBBB5D
MKPINALLIIGLMVSFAVSGCARTEYIEIHPQCTPPPEPTLPAIDRGTMWDALGDDRYRQLERYINGVWAFSDEQGAMLDSLCE